MLKWTEVNKTTIESEVSAPCFQVVFQITKYSDDKNRKWAYALSVTGHAIGLQVHQMNTLEECKESAEIILAGIKATLLERLS